MTDRIFTIADPLASAMIGWHSGFWHWNIATLINVPIGDYQAGQLANVAFHRWGADVTGALTYFDPQGGFEVSAAMGITFNGRNPVTDYLTGNEFHLEWSVSKYITKEFSLGVVGYFDQQFSDDSGSGARLGPNRGRVAGLGGTLGYNFVVGTVPISTRVKVFREFD